MKLTREQQMQVESILSRMTLDEKIGQMNQESPSIVGGFDVPFSELIEMLTDGRLAQEEFERMMSTAKQDFHEDEIRAGLVGSVMGNDPRKANELQKIDLFEISIVPIPANPRAEVTEIKSGRRTSAKDGDSIKGVIGKLNESISALEALLDDKAEVPEEGEDRPEANAAAEEPRESNPEKDNLLTYIKALEEDSYES